MPSDRPAPSKPPAPHWLLYSGIFLIFGPLGMLFGLVWTQPAGWLGALIMAVFSGTISLGWSYSFTSRRYWLIAPIILMSFVVPFWFFPWLGSIGVFDVGTSLTPGWRRVMLSVMIIAGVTAGFTLIIMHIRRTERAGERNRAELDLAGQIHRTLVPDVSLRTARLEILGRSIPSAEMGGDLVDVVMPLGEDGHVDVYLADVSGHGVKAGIVMGMVKSAIRTRLLGDADPHREPAPLHELLGDLNSVLEKLIAPEMFATFACLRFGSGTGPGADGVEFALAGHLPILHYRAGDQRVFELPNEHLPLGLEPDELFTSAAATAEPGDTFAMFTDGLSETADARGRQLGLAGVRDAFEANATKPLEELFDAVLAAAAAHGTTSDDRTLVLVRVI
jgi:serine phosphatase RsbU (regulator of sigma subunit)